MFSCEILLLDCFFPSVLQICYVEERISRIVSEGPFDIETKRVDCISYFNVSCLTKNVMLYSGIKHSTTVQTDHPRSLPIQTRKPN